MKDFFTNHRSKVKLNQTHIHMRGFVHTSICHVTVDLDCGYVTLRYLSTVFPPFFIFNIISFS